MIFVQQLTNSIHLIIKNIQCASFDIYNEASRMTVDMASKGEKDKNPETRSQSQFQRYLTLHGAMLAWK